MSWFDWLKSKPAAHSGDSGHTMDLSAGDHLNDAAFRSPGNDVDFKAQRQTRRENLYAVVREAMIRSEVLASRYKFKVLSLDTHGRQFLVMVDLMDATALPAHRFLAVEQLIVSHAAQQHGLFVKSVYWRSNEALPEPHHAPVASARPEVREVPAVAAPVSPAPVVAPAQRRLWHLRGPRKPLIQSIKTKSWRSRKPLVPCRVTALNLRLVRSAAPAHASRAT